METNSTLIIQKTVGDTVELPSGISSEGEIIYACWKYETISIAEWDGSAVVLPKDHKFTARVSMNPTNFNLTITSLKLQDSGHFIFVSETNETQYPTFTIVLRVQGRMLMFLLFWLIDVFIVRTYDSKDCL